MAKGQTAADLRGKTDAELIELLKTVESSLFTARFENYTNKLDDTAKLRQIRREIAKIKTIQSERRIAAVTPKKAEG
ncbi:MAG: 50S ribosomal protein L29 [Deltaproteobacteria bacterium]|nr:50S ribosomal protein L29 [Deltaproteobacteria bacterium]